MHHNHPDQPRSVIVCPDSFKGTADAATVARRLAEGWQRCRPQDRITLLPMADGGEGTLDAVAVARPDARLITGAPVLGPLGAPVPSRWLRLGELGVVELAAVAGLGFVPQPSPDTALAASTAGLGATMGQAWDAGVRSVVVALGGSASTDGGFGALRELGVSAIDAAGKEIIGASGGVLSGIHRLDTTRLRRDTPVTVLTDVRAPLTGPTGAAAVFGPQKGADPATVRRLDAGLRHWAGLWGERSALAEVPGAGAAGGVGFGFAAAWDARLTSGAAWVAHLSGLPDLVANADVVITGEGRFDHQSLGGKVVGHVLALPGSGDRWVVAGDIDPTFSTTAGTVSLTELSGSGEAARRDVADWLVTAGAHLAGRIAGS